MESNLYEDFLNHSDAYDFGVNLIIEAADPASGYKSNFIKETKISLGGNIVDRWMFWGSAGQKGGVKGIQEFSVHPNRWRLQKRKKNL